MSKARRTLRDPPCSSFIAFCAAGVAGARRCLPELRHDRIPTFWTIIQQSRRSYKLARLERPAMKITDIEVIELRVPGWTGATFDGSYDNCLVLVHTDGGITGIAEVDSVPSVIRAIVEGSPLAHPRHGVEGGGGRPGSAAGRGAVGPHVRLDQLLRPPRRRHPCHQRRRHRALGYARQGLGQAGLRDLLGRPQARPAARLWHGLSAWRDG